MFIAWVGCCTTWLYAFRQNTFELVHEKLYCMGGSSVLVNWLSIVGLNAPFSNRRWRLEMVADVGVYWDWFLGASRVFLLLRLYSSWQRRCQLFCAYKIWLNFQRCSQMYNLFYLTHIAENKSKHCVYNNWTIKVWPAFGVRWIVCFSWFCLVATFFLPLL